MKRLLPLIVGMLPLVGVGQNAWPADDAAWHYTFHTWWPPEGNFARYRVDGVETIYGKACSRVMVDYIQWNQYYVQGTVPEAYLHFDGDTLWHLFRGDSSFYPLVCFNAVPGDSWHPLPVDSMYMDMFCTVMPIEVLDTFTTYYNGQPYRAMNIGYQQEGGHLRWWGAFNERTFKDPNVGQPGSLFPFYNTCNPDIIVDWYNYKLLCYTDSELSLVADDILDYQNGSDCEYPWDHVGIEDKAKEARLLIYPNPATTTIRIQLPEGVQKATSIAIYDMQGRLVRQQPFTTTMDVSTLSRGTYAIVVHTEEGNYRGMIQKE